MNIDHIMPQTAGAWDVDENEHEMYVNTWGNLVPLSAPLNSKKSNRTWEDVQVIYRDENIYRTPKTIANLKSWDIEAIAKRSADIAVWACDRWSDTV